MSPSVVRALPRNADQQVTGHFHALEDRFHLLRAIGIAVAVTAGIVVVEEFLL